MLSLAAKRMIGFGALVAGILIVVLGVTQPNPFKDTTSYWVEFTSVQGLGAIGRDVRVAGINVGDIGDVKRDGDNAIVQINLDQDIPLHTDARADMRPHTLFEGSTFIDLSPGSPSAPLLEPGETIPIEQTSNYVTLDEALRVLRPEIRENLRELAEVGAKTLRGEAITGLQTTLKNSPELMRDLRGPVRALQGAHRVELEGAIAGMSRTVDAVAEHEADLIPLAEHTARTATALTVDGGRPLDQTLAVLPAALRELRDGAPELTGLVDRLDRFSVPVADALPDFTDAVHGATPLLAKSIPVLNGVTPLIGDLRKISGRLADASPSLAGLMRKLDPVTETFGDSVLPVLLQDSRRGPPTYEQLLATFSAADAVFRPYQTASQNPLGAGHVWNIGTYIDPSGPFAGLLGGGTPGSPSSTESASACEPLKGVNPDLVAELSARGAC
jgi:phospholipid/cholesterol/gamma-HCH transport system substrate-binding protein